VNKHPGLPDRRKWPSPAGEIHSSGKEREKQGREKRELITENQDRSGLRNREKADEGSATFGVGFTGGQADETGKSLSWRVNLLGGGGDREQGATQEGEDVQVRFKRGLAKRQEKARTCGEKGFSCLHEGRDHVLRIY